MHNTVKAVLAALALAAAGIQIAMAASSETITIHNQTPSPVWVTIYTPEKTQLASGCARAFGTYQTTLSLAKMVESQGGIYIRYENKVYTDCTGNTTHDSHYGGLIGLSTSGTMDEYVPSVSSF